MFADAFDFGNKTMTLQVPKDVTYLPQLGLLDPSMTKELRFATNMHGSDTDPVKVQTHGKKDVEVDSTLANNDKVARTFDSATGKLKDEKITFSKGQTLDTKFDASGNPTTVEMKDIDKIVGAKLDADGHVKSTSYEDYNVKLETNYDGKGMRTGSHRETTQSAREIKDEFGITGFDHGRVSENLDANSNVKDATIVKADGSETDRITFDSQTHAPKTIERSDKSGDHFFNIDPYNGKENPDMYKKRHGRTPQTLWSYVKSPAD